MDSNVTPQEYISKRISALRELSYQELTQWVASKEVSSGGVSIAAQTYQYEIDASWDDKKLKTVRVSGF